MIDSKGMSGFTSHLSTALAISLSTLWLGTAPVLAGEKSFAAKDTIPIETKPIHRFEVLVETAQMFNIDGNPNRYYFSTQMISLAYQPFPMWQVGPIRVKMQVLTTLFVSAILRGPENYYIGGGPQLRFIFPIGDTRFSFFGGGGGGAGVADANEGAKNDHGLGQDFTFIILAYAGLRYDFSDRWAVWAGPMWHHLSNANLSEPGKTNIGPDELGVLIGGGYSF